MGRLLRFWFSFEDPVPGKKYLQHGFALMALKYSVDAVLIGTATGTLWTPTDYLQSVPLLISSRLTGAPLYLAPALAIWALPFLWIGMSMTIRRLLDAGRSAWWALLFFIPVVSYLLFAGLAAAPSSPDRKPAVHALSGRDRFPSTLFAMATGASLGLILLWVGVIGLESYGLAVFMGAPFIIGLITAFQLRRRYPASVRETFNVVALTMALVAGSAFLVGFEGAICLAMAAPLALTVAFMGGLVGRFFAASGEPLRIPAHSDH